MVRNELFVYFYVCFFHGLGRFVFWSMCVFAWMVGWSSIHFVIPCFLLSGCPYCLFSTSATSDMSKAEKQQWHAQAKQHLSPEHPSFFSCGAYVRLTLLLASMARKIVSITTFGKFASLLLFWDSPGNAANNKKEQQCWCKTRCWCKELGQTPDGYGCAMVAAVQKNQPHEVMLVHPAAYIRRLKSDQRFPNIQDAKDMVGFMELRRCMAFIDQEICAGHVQKQLSRQHILKKMYDNIGIIGQQQGENTLLLILLVCSCTLAPLCF
jgi:hypothetical protein